MIKQGFIKEIGEPRTFTDKDGNARHAYPVVCDFPYTTQNGRDATDELVADLYADKRSVSQEHSPTRTETQDMRIQ